VLLQGIRTTLIIGLGQAPPTDNDKIETYEFRLILPETLSDNPLDPVTINCPATDLL
jgi:hypothetical protein